MRTLGLVIKTIAILLAFIVTITITKWAAIAMLVLFVMQSAEIFLTEVK